MNTFTQGVRESPEYSVSPLLFNMVPEIPAIAIGKKNSYKYQKWKS